MVEVGNKEQMVGMNFTNLAHEVIDELFFYSHVVVGFITKCLPPPLIITILINLKTVGPGPGVTWCHPPTLNFGVQHPVH